MVRSFEDKVEAGVDFFQNIFKEPEGFPIHEILEVFGLFPMMITEEMNEYITKEIYEEDINQVLHSFKKGKAWDKMGSHWNFFSDSMR